MPHIDYKTGSVTMIHVGNEPSQTEDCVLVGLSRTNDFVGNSREAFAALFNKIYNEICQIEIFDEVNQKGE